MTATMEAVGVEGTNFLNLTPLDKAMKRLANRRADRVVAAVEDPGALHLSYRSAADTKGGAFVIRPDNAKQVGGEIGKHLAKHGEMELTENAVRSILRHGKISLPEKMLPSELPRLGTKALRMQMEAMQGLHILTKTDNGVGQRKVEAFMPGKLSTMSDHVLMDGVLERLSARYKDQIRGVRFQSEHESAQQRYWVVFGNPVMDEKPSDVQLKTYPMLDVTSSDIGLGPVTLSLGLMRIVCINGAIYTDWEAGRASWNRIGEPGAFYDQMQKVIDNAGQFGSDMNAALMGATKRSLGMHGMEVVQAFNKAGIYNKKQAEIAEKLVQRDDPMTDYDMFQVSTESAQGLPMDQRKRAETLALRVIVREGGFEKVVREGMSIKVFKPETEAVAS